MRAWRRALVLCGLVLAAPGSWGPLGPSIAHAQGVLSALGQLSMRGVSLDDPRVPLATRVAQARSLGTQGDEDAAVRLLLSALSARPPRALFVAVVASLAERRSARAVPELLRVLRARPFDPSLVCRALVAIGGPQVIDAMASLAAAGDRQVKFHALRALALLAPDQAAPLLLVALASSDEVARRVALQIAVDVPEAQWLDALTAAIRERAEQPEVIELAWALSRVPGGAGLVGLLQAVPTQGRPTLHLAVAIAVCVRAHAEVLDPSLRAKAMAVMERLEPEAQRAAVQGFLGGERVAVIGSEPMSRTRAMALRRALSGRDGQPISERVAAVGSLLALDDPKAWVPVVAALTDREDLVRREAVRWLSRVDALEVRDALRRRVALETEPEIAALAQWAVDGDPRAFDDPWGAGRALLSATVDREVAPLAR